MWASHDEHHVYVRTTLFAVANFDRAMTNGQLLLMYVALSLSTVKNKYIFNAHDQAQINN